VCHALPKAVSEIETLSPARFKALVDRDAGYLREHYTSDFQAVGGDGPSWPRSTSHCKLLMRDKN
jgi:hypothetical protein